MTNKNDYIETPITQESIQNVAPVIEPVVSPVDILLPWSNQINNYHNVRVLCDLSGLSVDEKNLICACIYQESQFFNYLANGQPIKHENIVNKVITSTDWGIVQINDYFHVGANKDFPSVQYILDNPDKAVQYMINCYKNGILKIWVSYSSGAYKQWLLPRSPMWGLHVAQ